MLLYIAAAGRPWLLAELRGGDCRCEVARAHGQKRLLLERGTVARPMCPARAGHVKSAPPQNSALRQSEPMQIERHICADRTSGHRLFPRRRACIPHRLERTATGTPAVSNEQGQLHRCLHDDRRSCTGVLILPSPLCRYVL